MSKGKTSTRGWRPMTVAERGPRCCVTGLFSGDCSQRRVADSPYCYYHGKLASGAIEGCVDARGREVSCRELYPVWPLPPRGYVLTGVAA